MTTITAVMVLWAIVGAITASYVICFLLSLVWAWATMRPRSEFWRSGRRTTVEEEQENTREIAAHGYWWHGVTTQVDDHDVPFALDSTDDRDEFLRRHNIGTRWQS